MLLPSACGRFGYDSGESALLRPDDSGAGSGGRANGADSGGTLATGGGGVAAGGEGGAAGGEGGAGPSADAGSAGANSDADAGLGGGDAGSQPDPDAGLRPCAPDAALRQRPESDPPVVVAGNYDMLNPGWWRMVRDNDWVSLHGQGYVAMRWEIEYATLAGEIDPPTISPTGTFLRVGGGGGYNLDDPKPGTTGTYMGNQQQGISHMAPGVETPWHIEFYYLDGDVTIVLNERGLLNIEVQSQPYSQVVTPGSGVYSPGVVCDRP